MAYGENKRAVIGRDLGIMSVAGLGVSASIGIGAAVIVDLFQHREASALYVINRWIIEVTSMMGLGSIPLYGVMLILMAIGAGSVLYFQPVTYRGAFAQGFGVLAALVTIAPSDLGTPLQSPVDEEPMMFTDPAAEASLVPTSLALTTAQARNEYQLRIKVEFPNGLKDDLQTMVRRGTLAGKLYNPETGVRYNLFRNSGARMTYDDGILRIETTIDGQDQSAELQMVLEADGYKIQSGSFTARTGANRIWDIEMEPSGTPLLFQRLRYSYPF